MLYSTLFSFWKKGLVFCFNEATIRSSLQISKNNLQSSTLPTTFLGDVTGTGGPSPGTITVDLDGKDVDLSALTTPGYARFQNLDATNFVELGIFDPETGVFYPLLEILPGESYVMRISRNIAKEFGTGTGTTGPTTNTLRLRADTANVQVRADVYES